jgi:hypothetical protein
VRGAVEDVAGRRALLERDLADRVEAGAAVDVHGERADLAGVSEEAGADEEEPVHGRHSIAAAMKAAATWGTMAFP